MSIERNKALARRFFELCGEGEMGTLGETVASSYVDHDPVPGQQPGLEGLRQKIAASRSAFPELHFEILDQIAEGDKVVTRASMHAAHAAGKRIEVEQIIIHRISEEGKLVEQWATADSQGMREQLGVAL